MPADASVVSLPVDKHHSHTLVGVQEDDPATLERAPDFIARALIDLEVAFGAPAAVQAVDPPAPVQVVELPRPLPLPGQLQRVEPSRSTPEPADPTARVNQANAAARMQPVRVDCRRGLGGGGGSGGWRVLRLSLEARRDKLLHSNETLRARKQASFIDMERTLFDAMRELNPDPSFERNQRTAAMIAIGAFRLALDEWRAGEAAEPLAAYLRAQFEVLSQR